MHKKSGTENHCDKSSVINNREGELRRYKDEAINKDGDESEIVEQMIEEEDVNDKLKFLENESWEETRFMFVKRETDEMDIDKNGEEENETTFMIYLSPFFLNISIIIV